MDPNKIAEATDSDHSPRIQCDEALILIRSTAKVHAEIIRMTPLETYISLVAGIPVNNQGDFDPCPSLIALRKFFESVGKPAQGYDLSIALTAFAKVFSVSTIIEREDAFKDASREISEILSNEAFRTLRSEPNDAAVSASAFAFTNLVRSSTWWMTPEHQGGGGRMPAGTLVNICEILRKILQIPGVITRCCRNSDVTRFLNSLVSPDSDPRYKYSAKEMLEKLAAEAARVGHRPTRRARSSPEASS